MRECLAGEFVGLVEQCEDQVLGADVVVSELLRVCAGDAERVGVGAGQSERGATVGWLGERGESLLGGLFAGPERAADLVPARAARPGAIDVEIEQLIGARTELAGERVGCGHAGHRRVGRDLRGERVEVGHHSHIVKANLTIKDHRGDIDAIGRESCRRGNRANRRTNESVGALGLGGSFLPMRR